MLCMILFVPFLLKIHGQNTQDKTDDWGRISFRPIISGNLELDGSASDVLKNKLEKIIVRNGMSGYGSQNRFFITAIPFLMEYEVSSTAPVRHIVELEVTFYTGDFKTNNKFNDVSINIRGIGRSKEKAYLNALKEIDTRSSVFRRFIDSGKEAIIALYNDHCDFALKDAQSYAEQKEYGRAINELMMIPDVCKDCYYLARDKAYDIYKLKMDDECAKNITRAKAAWSNYRQTEALNYLINIFPDVSCYHEAQKLMEEIKNHRCSVYLGRARAAWANGNSEKAVSNLANIPTDASCADEAGQIMKEIQTKLIKSEAEKVKAEYEEKIKNLQAAIDSVSMENEKEVNLRKIKAFEKIGSEYAKHGAALDENLEWLFK